MDDKRFDEIAKKLAGPSRRSFVKATLGMALGGALGSIGLRETSAGRKLRGLGETCRASDDCGEGTCQISSDGRRRCVEGGPCCPCTPPTILSANGCCPCGPPPD